MKNKNENTLINEIGKKTSIVNNDTNLKSKVLLRKINSVKIAQNASTDTSFEKITKEAVSRNSLKQTKSKLLKKPDPIEKKNGSDYSDFEQIFDPSISYIWYLEDFIRFKSCIFECIIYFYFFSAYRCLFWDSKDKIQRGKLIFTKQDLLFKCTGMPFIKVKFFILLPFFACFKR